MASICVWCCTDMFIGNFAAYQVSLHFPLMYGFIGIELLPIDTF